RKVGDEVALAVEDGRVDLHVVDLDLERDLRLRLWGGARLGLAGRHAGRGEERERERECGGAADTSHGFQKLSRGRWQSEIIAWDPGRSPRAARRIRRRMRRAGRCQTRGRRPASNPVRPACRAYTESLWPST